MRQIFSLTFLFLLLIFVSTAFPQKKITRETYRASALPPELKKGAQAVKRYESTSFKVFSTRKAVEKVHQIITVLEPAGQSFGELVLPYDSFRQLDNLDGALFDADGKEIRSLGSSDVSDYAATSGTSLYEDNRVRIAKLYHNTYPYTIEFEYEFEYHGYINWPSWYPEEKDASVEYSVFEVILSKENTLRYWKHNAPDPAVTVDGNLKYYLWEADSLEPFQEEPAGPDIADQYMSVRTAPDTFEIEKSSGNLSTWKSFGEWFYKLQAGKQTLPKQEEQDVRSLMEDGISTREKVRRAYAYLQSKTRYVSIQLGIGGWQPFDAAYVCEKGYGDCKALVNYMMSLLKAVDIPSYPALIYSGIPSINIIEDFPSNNFNHVILFVPLDDDTVWLECTNQNIPFGHISPYNENRRALLITPEGGVLTRTPLSGASQNCQIRNATVVLEANGNASGSIRTRYTGNQQDYITMKLKDASPKDREDWLKEYIDVPSFRLQSADFSQLENKNENVTLAFQIQLPQYSNIAGKKLLFQPNLMERYTYIPKQLAARKYPILHSYSYHDVDSIRYEIPGLYTVEVLPKPVTIETTFGKYSSMISATESGLLYVRHLEIRAAELPPEQYNEYRKFFQDVAQTDKAIAALKRKE